METRNNYKLSVKFTSKKKSTNEYNYAKYRMNFIFLLINLKEFRVLLRNLAEIKKCRVESCLDRKWLEKSAQ